MTATPTSPTPSIPDPRPAERDEPLRTYARFVKLEHTLFSLPLIVAGSLIGEWVLQQSGQGGALTWLRFFWILLAGAGARTFALALNRIIDHRLDAKNPRTQVREIPSGKMTLREAWGVALAGLVTYLVAVAFLPPICWWLSPLPPLVFVAYPYMKRFTSACHVGVGLGLALSPLGGYLAVTGTFVGAQWVFPLFLFTLFWVAGFDVIYATLDRDHDVRSGVHSLPAAIGREGSLRVSALLHTLAFLALLVWCVATSAGWPAWLCLAVVGGLLLWEQRTAERVELAFFRINSGLGFVVLAMVWSARLAGG